MFDFWFAIQVSAQLSGFATPCAWREREREGGVFFDGSGRNGVVLVLW